MILKGILLISIATPLANAFLYVPRDGGSLELELPAQESITDSILQSVLEDVPASAIHFDRATSCMELMSLPLSFFQDSLTPIQLNEIFLNKALGDLTGKFIKGRFEDHDLMDAKMDALKKKMSAMTVASLGENHDAVVAAVPSSWYKFLHPLTAIMSNSFNITKRSLAQLFCVSRSVLKSLTVGLFRNVKGVFSTITSLGITPGRVFTIASLLIGLINAFPTLSSLAFGVRIQDYVQGLKLLGQALNVLSNFVTKTVTKDTSMTIDTAQSLLPVRWFKSSAIVKVRGAEKFVLPGNVNIRLGPAVSGAKGSLRGHKVLKTSGDLAQDNATKLNRDTWMLPFEDTKRSLLTTSPEEEAPVKTTRVVEGWWPIGRGTSRRPSKPSSRHTKPSGRHTKPSSKPTTHKKPVGDAAEIDYEKLFAKENAKFYGLNSENSEADGGSSSF